ncbi:heat shock protein 70 family protein [Skeletonema marinoi]|uniref:Heat shock protein 70 family protein n=1 Tax=Skeletonema marinoi TaxID=267567 RepID=A0AAD8YJA3_9STRA|nr:heat shock protein 70 family protein [Skeletonema marinoi]
MEQPPPSNRKGGWIGIDLGTSNCTAAVWDLERSRCKVLRLGYKNLARPPPDGSSSGKGGKIVPSAILFVGDGDDKVGYEAISQLGNDETATSDASSALVTSFKRIVGMTSNQAREMQLSDGEFWDSLPFQAVIRNEDESIKEQAPKESNQSEDEATDVAYDVLGDTANGSHEQSLSTNESSSKTNKNEGVAIRIRPINSASDRLVTALDVTSTLLQSIRVAANEYLVGKNRSKILAPGMSPSETDTQPLIENCVIGVPAHYSLAQRTSIQIAAKEAGFSGYVGVMTESTAAAMSYGLFVTPTTSSDDNGKIILVFDMGGGTTDVTIAIMNSGNNRDAVQFRVLATAGDKCLGGDNVDELLARYVWKRLVSSTEANSPWKALDHQELVRQCRRAKEELCGDGDIDSVPVDSSIIAYDGKELNITRTEFDQAIEHLVDRAEHVVEEALLALEAQEPSSKVHEVVLVGGSTHIPTIRSMLSRTFPPPFVPELCTSISAETAVSQGLAIQAALVSGLVPLFELRNAMMLDTMPHSIGVWVCGSKSEKEAPYEKGDFIHAGDVASGHFVPILDKDTTLPAKGTTTFELANAGQNGVSIVAVENIGQDQYQCMGVFNFLLHHLEDCGNTRKVEVGMVLKESGQFIVSIFDELDPEHRAKGRIYLESKGLIDNEAPEEEKQGSVSGNEIGLILFCVAFFALYVTVKVLFNEIDLDNEL